MTTLADAIALEMDGTWQLLAAGPPMRQRIFRLQIKLREAMYWLPRTVNSPWDCGHLRGLQADDAEARAAWSLFRPRRPTLLIAVRPDAVLLATAVRALQATAVERPNTFLHPVRLLVLDAPTAMAEWSVMLHERARF